jgi:hypothetical protein
MTVTRTVLDAAISSEVHRCAISPGFTDQSFIVFDNALSRAPVHTMEDNYTGNIHLIIIITTVEKRPSCYEYSRTLGTLRI